MRLNPTKADMTRKRLKQITQGLTDSAIPLRQAQHIATLAANEAYALIARIVLIEESKIREESR